ncbi:MAG: hypothetical protein V1890_05135 [Candidatus Zixiibacteriota bacterium]
MRRTLPFALVTGVGFFMLVQYFVPNEEFEIVYEWILDWTIVIGCFAMLLGLWSLTRVNISKVQRKTPGWGYSLIAIAGLVFMLLVGFIPGQTSLERGSTFMLLFEYVYIPIQATMFSLLAFYIASAAYRAFRARTILATILLLSAIIIMLRLVPLGPLSEINQWLANFILTVPNMAAKRAFWIGVGLGVVATALKILLGIERTYMGRD